MLSYVFLTLLATIFSTTITGPSCCPEKKPTRTTTAAKKKPNRSKKHAVQEIKSIEEYRQKIAKNPLVIVKFYSTDCPACNAMSPVFQAASRNHEDVAFLNIAVDKDEFTPLADELNIQSIPTLIFFKDGEIVITKVGFYKEPAFEELILELKKPSKKATAKKESPKKQPKQPIEKTEPAKVQEKPMEQKPAPKKMAAGQVHEISTAAEYNAILASGKPVIIEISTEWCSACKQFTPIFKGLAAKYADQIDFYHADGEKREVMSAIKTEIKGYPTSLFIKNGKIVDTRLGAAAEKSFNLSIQSFLNK